MPNSIIATADPTNGRMTLSVVWRGGLAPSIARLDPDLVWRFVRGAAPATITPTNYRTNTVTNPVAGVDLTSYTSEAGVGGAAALSRVAAGGQATVAATFARNTWTTAPTSGTAGGISLGNGAALPATPAQAITASVYVRSSKAQLLAVEVRFVNGAAANGAPQGTAVAVPANTWTRLSAAVTVPAGSTSMTLAAVAAAGPSFVQWAAADTLDVQGALIEASSLGTYFDGRTVGAAWAGAADASASVLTIEGTWTSSDFEAPADTAFHYTVKDSSGTTLDSAVLVLPSLSVAWLKHPTRPDWNIQLNLTEMPDLTRVAVSGIFPILGRDTPIAITMPRQAATSATPLRWLTETAADLVAVLRIFADGSVLLLSIPGGNGFGTRWVAPGDLLEPRLGPYGAESARVWECPFSIVSRPA